MRKYQKTHPWIIFSLDMRKLESDVWILLGEAVSKIEHIAGVPLYPNIADQLHSVYLIKGAVATAAIEGNTLTEEEAKKILDGQLKLPSSRKYLAQEIDNIVNACNEIGNKIINGNAGPITTHEICRYNELVLTKLPLEEDVDPGIFRKHSVTVGRYKAVPPEDCPYLMEKYCEWLNNIEIPDGYEKIFPILIAITSHLFFVWIHPFADGNGRTARLIEFRYLLQAGFPTPAAHLLSNFYNLTRTRYYQELDKASKKGGVLSEFIAYAVQGLVDQLREQLDVIREWQLDSTWRNYVFEQFGGKLSETKTRQRRLVLDLSEHKEDSGWVKKSRIFMLTPKLANKYANKTQKTLTRDLNMLHNMALIEWDKNKRQVRANKKLIRAFLPARAI